MRREWVQVLSHLKPEMQWFADPPTTRYSPYSLSLSFQPWAPCWYTAVASQMIRNNRQALPPLLPIPPSAKTPPAWRTQSSYHHCTTQGDRMQAKERRRRRIGKERRQSGEVERERSRHWDTQKKEQRQDLSFNPFSHHAVWPVPVPMSKYTSNTLWALRHLTVCVCVC